MRQISFIIGTVYAQERSQSGLPQVHDGPVDLSLSNPEFIFRLLLHLSFLEGDNLCLVLVVELLQRLLLVGGALAVESRLLPVTI